MQTVTLLIPEPPRLERVSRGVFRLKVLSTPGDEMRAVRRLIYATMLLAFGAFEGQEDAVAADEDRG